MSASITPGAGVGGSLKTSTDCAEPTGMVTVRGPGLDGRSYPVGGVISVTSQCEPESPTKASEFAA